AVSSYVLRSETGLGALFDFYEDSFGTIPGVQSVNYQRSGDKTAAFAEPWIGEHAGKAVLLPVPHLRTARPLRPSGALPEPVRRHLRRRGGDRRRDRGRVPRQHEEARGVRQGRRDRDLRPRRGSRATWRAATLDLPVSRGDPGAAPRQASGQLRRRKPRGGSRPALGHLSDRHRGAWPPDAQGG